MSDAEKTANAEEIDNGNEKEEEIGTKPEDVKKEEEQPKEADESVDGEKSPTSSPVSSPSKKAVPKKTPQKRKDDADHNGSGEVKSDHKEDEEEEEDESSDEELVGLLDGPVKLMEGKRERRKTERLTFDTKKEVAETKFEVEEGKGIKLGNIPNIEFHISRTNSENFKALYKFLFGRSCKLHEIKKNIRKFSGFNFEKGSPEFEKKENILLKYTMVGLKELCLWLDLDKKGTKDEILERILNFCLKPAPSGKPHPQKKKKSKAVKKTGKKRKRKADGSGDAKKTKGKKKSSEDTEGDEEDEDEVEDESDEEKEETTMEEEDEDEDEDEEPKRKKAKLDTSSPKKKVDKKPTPKSSKKMPAKKAITKKATPKKGTPKKGSPKKGSPKKKASIQITPKSAPKAKSKQLVEDSDDSSDDEPLIRKAEPSEAQIEQTIKSFLDKANLELVTMKMVCKKVYETYPDFNLTHKKDFIKATVRSIIS